ncbi:hypothetical protein EV361DRAFT_671130 [Lentinula raphanica]|nr:hypothetical protein EV361DRAFT_671130 [Lentinula raphanica]
MMMILMISTKSSQTGLLNLNHPLIIAKEFLLGKPTQQNPLRRTRLKSPRDQQKGFFQETDSAESAPVQQSQSEPLFMDDDRNDQLLNRLARLKSPPDHCKEVFGETNSAESAPVQQAQSEPLFMDDNLNEQLLNRLAQLKSPLDNQKGVFQETNSAESAPVQQTQSESQFMNDWTPLFANIASVSQAEGYSKRDMHQTEVNNDNSTENDFNNNYTGATRYNGAHNDHRRHRQQVVMFQLMCICCLISLVSSIPDTPMPSLD